MNIRIKSYMKNPVNAFFMQHRFKINYFKKLTSKNAREVSFHFYPLFLEVDQDLLLPGEPCTAMFLVMKGVVGVYIRLKTGEELFTDYLGEGSLIGQYSVIEQEIMIIGFRVVSHGGASLI
jgi:CRP-like cAMP-binding protein